MGMSIGDERGLVRDAVPMTFEDRGDRRRDEAPDEGRRTPTADRRVGMRQGDLAKPSRRCYALVDPC